MESVKESVGNFSWKPKTHDHTDTPAVGDETESKIQSRTIKLAHFMHAINEVSPSSSTGSHSELYRWHEQFGQKRNLNDSRHGGPQVTTGRHLGKSSSDFGGIGGYESRAGGFGGGRGSYGGITGGYNASTDIYKGVASGYGRGAVGYNRGPGAFSGTANGYGRGGDGGSSGGFSGNVGGNANSQRNPEEVNGVTVKGDDAERK
jgi:hypothetical protein